MPTPADGLVRPRRKRKPRYLSQEDRADYINRKDMIPRKLINLGQCFHGHARCAKDEVVDLAGSVSRKGLRRINHLLGQISSGERIRQLVAEANGFLDSVSF